MTIQAAAPHLHSASHAAHAGHIRGAHGPGAPPAASAASSAAASQPAAIVQISKAAQDAPATHEAKSSGGDRDHDGDKK